VPGQLSRYITNMYPLVELTETLGDVPWVEVDRCIEWVRYDEVWVLGKPKLHGVSVVGAPIETASGYAQPPRIGSYLYSTYN
jgi:hypothetical protein